MTVFEKRRPPATPGTIPAALDMFRAEVRFYREIAPELDVRVPRCLDAADGADGTHLVLEDLSAWQAGADPVALAAVLRAMHDRWRGVVSDRWPWLRPSGVAAGLIGDLYDRTWPALAGCSGLTPAVRRLGESLVGAVERAELAEGDAGVPTLCHGDASTANAFTSPTGEIALVDWEDVRAAPGVIDLAWLLVSSTPAARWPAVRDAYGDDDGLVVALPAAAAQGLLSLKDVAADDRITAAAWVDRLEAAARVLGVDS